ncbi:MAG: DUF1415 domain-containing protein [Burkholderiales bacterium]|nr:DUF1415 domain-containing protein [Burkholderiales bacterium]
MSPEQQQVAGDVRRWLERAVIGLNLCPFAKAVHVKQQVRYVVSEADDAAGVLRDLGAEVALIAQSDPALHDTTLLVVPDALADFLSFNDVVAQGERLLRKRGLEGVIQLASFHPRFVFADAAEDDVTNCTNRSPYPVLHLLREASIERAVAAFPDAADIYEANMAKLRELGPQGWASLGVGPSR